MFYITEVSKLGFWNTDVKHIGHQPQYFEAAGWSGPVISGISGIPISGSQVLMFTDPEIW